MHIGRAMTATALALALALGSGSAGWAQPSAPHPGGSAAAQVPLPDGWALRSTASGVDLVWQAPDRVPVGGAMVQFYSGDRPLGQPRATKDQRTFRLPIDGIAARDLTDLQVRAGGRRIDAVVAAERRTAAAPAQRTAAPLPPNPVDPGVPGGYATVSGDYTLSSVQLPGFAAPVEMQGRVVAPKSTSNDHPLVLLLHGRHDTCYQGTTPPTLEWPCPAGRTPVPNHLGYLRIQRLLASQGYVTVSISANGISAQDNGSDGMFDPPEDGGAQARSSLIRLHLGHWADWAGAGRAGAPDVVRSAPAVDMAKVLLMGHSRGGEGVNRAAIDSLTPPPAAVDGYRGAVRWQIKGMALIAPTLFGHNPAPDVPSMVILPACDGDIADLQGQLYADATRGVSRGAALHSSVYVVGANHNYFNSEWTPGLSQAPSWDDYPSRHDPVCRTESPQRLTPENQQQVGATYVAAAAATFVAAKEEDREKVRPLLDGSGVRAPSVHPAQVASHALGGNRTPLLLPDPSTVLSGSGARLCDAAGADSGGNCHGAGGHFARFPSVQSEVGRHAIALTWSAPGTALRFQPPTAASMTGAQSVALRLFVQPGSVGNRVEVAIVDSAGRRAVLGERSLDGFPWPTQTEKDWAQEVRVPLGNAIAAGLDLSRIAALELVPRSNEGRAWLIDAWGWRPGTPEPRPTALPRVDLGEITVAEGDSGTTTYRVPARVSGSGSGRLRLFVVDRGKQVTTARVVTVSPGTTTIDIPIPVTGNTEPGYGQLFTVAAKAIRGVQVGDVYGGLTAKEDDVS